MKTRWLLIACVGLSLGGCASLSHQIQPAKREATVIATKIKTTHIETLELAAAAIHVESD